MEMTSTLTAHHGTQVHLDHNRREKNAVASQTHIRKDGEHETWIDRDPMEVCRELFGPSIEAYNEKQRKARHPDRVKTLESYIAECTRTEVSPTGKKKQYSLIHETVLYAGGKDGELPTPLRKEILHKEVDEFQKQNPNCVVIGAYYHNDERYWDETSKNWKNSAPHVHLDYIMVSRNNRRGLKVQSSESGALRQMGYDVKRDENGKPLTKTINGKKVQTYLGHPDIHVCAGKTKYWTTDGRITSDRSDPKIDLDSSGNQRVAACTPIALWTAEMQTHFEEVARQVCRGHKIDLTITHTSKTKPGQSFDWLSRQTYGMKQELKTQTEARDSRISENMTFNMENERLRKEIAKEKSELETAEQKLSEQNDEIKALEATRAGLKQDVEKLSGEKTELSKDLLIVRTKAVKAKKELSQTESELKKKKSLLQSLANTVQDLLRFMKQHFKWLDERRLYHEKADDRLFSDLTIVNEEIRKFSERQKQAMDEDKQEYLSEEEEEGRHLW